MTNATIMNIIVLIGADIKMKPFVSSYLNVGNNQLAFNVVILNKYFVKTTQLIWDVVIHQMSNAQMVVVLQPNKNVMKCQGGSIVKKTVNHVLILHFVHFNIIVAIRTKHMHTVELILEILVMKEIVETLILVLKAFVHLNQISVLLDLDMDNAKKINNFVEDLNVHLVVASSVPTSLADVLYL